MLVEDGINYLLSNAQHKVFIALRDALKELNITPIQYGIIQCIIQKDMSSPKEFADFFEVETPTISGILNRMEQKGLLVRAIDPDNRRQIIVKLTDAAYAIENRALQIVEDTNSALLSNLTSAEQTDLKYYLKKIG